MNINTLLDEARVTTKIQKTYITNLDPNEFISKTKVNIGDIIIHKKIGGINDIYLYDGNLIPIESDNHHNESLAKEKIVEMTPKFCKCCGAPMNNSNTCEYCGVSYK